jgi:hypothetical protein
MKYARMKVQIIRNNPNSNPNIPPTTTNNNNTTKSQDEINPQLADPAIVAKVSFYRFNKFSNFS